MDEYPHSGFRSLAATLLGVFGFAQIPFGFYLVVSEPFAKAPNSRVEGIAMLVVGPVMLWVAIRIWPKSALAIPTTDTVRSQLRWSYGLVGTGVAVLVGIGFISGGFAAIPSTPLRAVVAALGAIGLAVLVPAVWVLHVERKNLRRAQALDDHGVTTTARIVQLSTMKMAEWGALLAGHPEVGGGYLATYLFDLGVPTAHPVGRESYERLRVGDPLTVLYLPEDPKVSRSA